MAKNINEFEDILGVKDDSPLINNRLLEIISNCVNLSDSEKMNFKSLAVLFNKDFKNNIYRTSLELSEAYPVISADSWMRFLNFPDIKIYFSEFRNEELEQKVDLAIKEGTNVTGNVKMKALLNKERSIDNSKIILVRLPDREDRTYVEQIV